MLSSGKLGRRKAIGACTACAIVGLCLTPFGAAAQQSVAASVLQRSPVIDGDIGTEEWSGAQIIDQPFVQIVPEFGVASPFRTVVRIGQTETAIYVAFEVFDPNMSRLSAAVTQRDGGLDGDDSVSVALDSFGDDRTAYLFRTNALANQEDGRIADNGRTVDQQWDCGLVVRRHAA